LISKKELQIIHNFEDNQTDHLSSLIKRDKIPELVKILCLLLFGDKNLLTDMNLNERK
jgi:hypothetical protein